MQESFPSQPTPTPEVLPPLAAHVQFETNMQSLAANIAELQARPEIMEAGKELIDEFDLKQSLFDSLDRSVAFAGIASTWADAKTQTGETGEASKAFVANATALLAYKHSDKLSFAKEAIEAEDTHVDDATAVRVYDRYTDKQLSEAVREKIDAGFLDETKQRLGVTPENEDEYEVRVLTIGDESQTYGLEAPQPDYSLPYGHPDFELAVQTQEDVRHWRKGLEKRTEEFAKELGMEGLFGPAWVTTLDGKRTLCISSGLAEKVIDPTVIKNSSWYGQNDLERDLAIFSHEYIHTQGSLAVDQGVAFGINLEELRAEHFSGDKHGYQDIKGLFGDYYVLTGQSIAEEFDGRIKGGTVAEVYGSIANRVGLSTMLELIMASPKNYIANQSNSYIRNAYGHIGGFDGVEQRIWEAEVAAGRGDEVEQRIATSAQRLATIVAGSSSFTVEFWQNYRKAQGLSFMTNKIAEQIQELTPK